MKSLLLIGFCAAVALAVARGESRGEIVYHSKFSEGSSAGWSKTRISTPPKSGRKYLGMFGGKVTAAVRLPTLPPHRLLRVRCSLFQIYSPDGSQTNYGPDFWGMSVGGGPELLRTTFNFSRASHPADHPQAFPDEFPLTHPAGTGSAERGSLGFVFDVEDREQANQSDMVFRLDVVFPHDAPSAEIQFWSQFTDGPPDEAWGLESVEVEAVPDFTVRSEAELQGLWKELLGDDAMKASVALWKLVECGPRATEFAAHQIGGDSARERVAGLIRDLSSSEVLVREKARRAIDQLDPQALPALRIALLDPATPERFRKEFGDLIGDIKAESPYFVSRVGHLLRVLDSPESRALLVSLTGVSRRGEVKDSFARLRWSATHAIAEDPWVLRSYFTPDGRKFITAGGDGARTWDVATGHLVFPLYGPGSRCLAVSPDGATALVGGKMSQAAVWTVETGALRSVLRGHTGEMWGAAFLPDSQHLITGAGDGLRWWELGNPISTQSAPLLAPVRYLALSPDGKTLAVAECGQGRNLLTLRDSATGELRRKVEAFRDTITSLAFSPDGKVLAATAYTGGARLYDVETGELRRRFEGAKPQNESAVFSPDGQYLCVTGGGGPEVVPPAPDLRGVHLYRLSDGVEIWHTSNIEKSCLTAAFSPDGQCLAGTDAGRNVYLWEIFRTPPAAAR